MYFFFSSRRRHTRWPRDWSSDVCSSDLGVGLGNGATQGIHVAGQIVVTHHQRLLSLALIPQIPHPQRGGMGRIEAVLVIAKRLQLMLAPLHKRAVHRRRGAKDRKSTRLNSSHVAISYAVFCL